jgi:cell division protein FtsA
LGIVLRLNGRVQNRKDVGAPAGRPGIIAALDVGSTKVACFIAKVHDARGPARTPVNVIGVGHQVSRGVKCGAVVDMVEVEESIRSAVDQAERMSGVTIHEVVASFSAGSPRSFMAQGAVELEGQPVTEREMARAIASAQSEVELGGLIALHAIPVTYSIDASKGVRDPVGMFGDVLGVNLHMVGAEVGPVRNLGVCIERCHLEMAGLAVAPYASGLASLVEDEMDLGVTLIDLGGGTTSVAVFSEGSLIHCGVVPVGGHLVTSDLARGLSTTLAQAERLKTLFGSALVGTNDDKAMLTVPLIGEADPEAVHQVPRSMLTSIIRPRIEETFEMVRDLLEEAGIGRLAGRCVVVTGGASQLNGVKETAARVLGKQVRLGRPIRLTGLPDAASGPAFSTVAGLLSYLVHGPQDTLLLDTHSEKRKGAHQISRIGRWFIENF